MFDVTNAAPPDAALNPAGLADVLLSVSLTGIMLLRPVFNSDNEELIDFTWERLNPAAQRMLRLPERPADSFLTLFPMARAAGVFGFYRDAFLSGQLAHRQNMYQHEWLDGYYVLAAQRCEDVLVVSFTDANDELNVAATDALRESRAREQAARAEADAQRQRLEALIAQAPALIASLTGPRHVVELANEDFRRMFGNREMVGKPYAEAAPELVDQQFIDLLDAVYRTGETYYGREAPAYIDQHNTGTTELLYFNFIYQATRDAAGQISGVLIFASEVTAQVLARQEREALLAQELAVARRQVEEREELYQIFEEAPVIVALLRGPEHSFYYRNPAFQALFPDRALTGRLYADAMPEIVAVGLMPVLDQVYATGQPYYGTALPVVTTPPDGAAPHERYYDFSYHPYQEDGQIVGISIFAYDVSGQVLARRERDARQQELTRIFAQAPVAITVLRGPQHVIELANAAICAIWGRTENELLGRPYFEAVPETAGQGFEEVFAEVLRTGEPLFINEAPVTLDRARTGRPALGYFNFIFQALREDQQRAVGIVAVGTEVTDQVVARQLAQDLNEELAVINEEMQATNEELRNTNDRLTRTNADLDTFVYSASHDLKSPITNIEGLLLALRQQLPPAALRAELVPRLLEMMDGAVDRFQQTLGHLTDVSRLQQVLFEQPAEAVDFPALVEAVRLDILPELTAAAATLTLDVASCPTLYFPAKNLRSILYNLLSNAVKYRAPDRAPEILLRCRPAAPGQVVLAVQDNGLGLSEQQQGELFQLFRRLHSHVSGSGVGLYMVKKMVDNAGGTLTVQSQPGVGSTFIITLPRAIRQ